MFAWFLRNICFCALHLCMPDTQFRIQHLFCATVCHPFVGQKLWARLLGNAFCRLVRAREILKTVWGKPPEKNPRSDTRVFFRSAFFSEFQKSQKNICFKAFFDFLCFRNFKNRKKNICFKALFDFLYL